jgi:hypothetical protein
MRALSVTQASRCETAKSPKCRCRCKGKLHGAGRTATADAWFFEGLARDDPHHIPDASERDLRRRAAAAKRRTSSDQGLLSVIFEPEQTES